MEQKENLKINLKQFKGHYRKFPWALIFRIFFALLSIGLIFFMIRFVSEIKSKNPENKDEIQLDLHP